MEKPVNKCTSLGFIIMGSDNLVGLKCCGGFDTGVILKGHTQWVSKGILCLWIPIIGRVRPIGDKVFFKLGVSFDGLLIRKKILLGCSYHIETHIGVVV